jgi:hypothetical protein
MKDVGLDTRTRTHHKVPQSDKMVSIFHLFCKEICKIHFTTNMLNLDKVVFHIFSNQIFVHLTMSETFGGAMLGPIDTGIVIIK